MNAARNSNSAKLPIQRPIENSYVVPDTQLIAGEYPGSPPYHSVHVRNTKLSAFLDAGVTAIVDLTAPKDRLVPYEPALREMAKGRGIELRYDAFPIPDMNVCDDKQMCRVLDAIDEHLAAKRVVYVHCWGGVGRTGTVVGCWLVRHGKMGEEALAEVSRLFATVSADKRRRHPEGSPQTAKQREMIEEWPESIMFRLTSEKDRESRRRREERLGGGARPRVEHQPVTAGLPEVDSATRSPDGSDEAEDDEDSELAVDPLELEEEEMQDEREQRVFLSSNAGHMLTRVRGCLLGGALGDALGWKVEFQSLGQIRSKYGADGITELDGGTDGVAQITDDTQMTLFTAEGILRSTTRHMEHWAYREPPVGYWGGVHMPNPDVMRHAYLRWLLTQRGRFPGAGKLPNNLPPGDPGWLVGVERLWASRAPGNTCLSAMGAAEGGSIEKPLNNSKGCGGVMRVAPIGLIPCEDPFAYAAMAASITHGHPSGYLAAGAYAMILSTLLYDRVGDAKEPTLRDAVELACERLVVERGHEETLVSLTQAVELASQPGEPSAERVESLGAGWVAEEALAIGVYCALVADDFEHGVRLAVNHSGDSDSTGAIAGGLLGVQFGEYGLPREWLGRLEVRDVISSVGEDLLVGYGGGAGWRERYPGA